MLDIHPIAQTFPALSEHEFKGLCASIADIGQTDPILLVGGKIADGRSRALVCEKLKLEPRYVEWDGQGSLPALIAARNICRRHLSQDNLDIATARLIPFFEEEARERRNAKLLQGKKSPLAPTGANGKIDSPTEGKMTGKSGKAAAQAAKATGTKTRSAERARKVLARAPAEVVAAVEAGTMTLNQAEKVVNGTEPPKVKVKRLNKANQKAKAKQTKDVRLERIRQGERCIKRARQTFGWLGAEAAGVVAALDQALAAAEALKAKRPG